MQSFSFMKYKNKQVFYIYFSLQKSAPLCLPGVSFFILTLLICCTALGCDAPTSTTTQK